MSNFLNMRVTDFSLTGKPIIPIDFYPYPFSKDGGTQEQKEGLKRGEMMMEREGNGE